MDYKGYKMKAETLIQMMEEDKYKDMTCKEFAMVVRRSGVIEEEELSFLTDPDWKPESVTHHTNKEAEDVIK